MYRGTGGNIVRLTDGQMDRCTGGRMESGQIDRCKMERCTDGKVVRWGVNRWTYVQVLIWRGVSKYNFFYKTEGCW